MNENLKFRTKLDKNKLPHGKEITLVDLCEEWMQRFFRSLGEFGRHNSAPIGNAAN